mmetsp:Transcript_9634/g.18335  ORF Transcript_9634/g.18335 Transcript_9634/m.18335 type:complete len:143 (-) Transcript_9634:275-703(-)|eukprot:CAMPEP_0175139782 /NCGR_PEP_ID=MMETSP0087-20121206/11104_1 /TAXON_ID=136419 /ORGANISM="Unknown Unknown, Strain D1" /LENGTH=142 /DNA_ID=CAMNT_0016422851 /DNA_START=28 /DNA_END=456 /DNA_ORIENTATION=+
MPINEDECKSLFEMFDKQKTGKVRTKNLPALMRSLGRHPSDKQLVQYYNEHGKELDFATFSKVMNECQEKDPNAIIMDAFRLLDKDNTGKISTSELRHMMTNLGEKLAEEEFDELLRNANVDLDGQMTKDELTKILTPQEAQ